MKKIALFKENPNPTFIIGNLLKIQKKYFYSLMRNILSGKPKHEHFIA